MPRISAGMLQLQAAQKISAPVPIVPFVATEPSCQFFHSAPVDVIAHIFSFLPTSKDKLRAGAITKHAHSTLTLFNSPVWFTTSVPVINRNIDNLLRMIAPSVKQIIYEEKKSLYSNVFHHLAETASYPRLTKVLLTDERQTTAPGGFATNFLNVSFANMKKIAPSLNYVEDIGGYFFLGGEKENALQYFPEIKISRVLLAELDPQNSAVAMQVIAENKPQYVRDSLVDTSNIELIRKAVELGATHLSAHASVLNLMSGELDNILYLRVTGGLEVATFQNHKSLKGLHVKHCHISDGFFGSLASSITRLDLVNCAFTTVADNCNGLKNFLQRSKLEYMDLHSTLDGLNGLIRVLRDHAKHLKTLHVRNCQFETDTCYELEEMTKKGVDVNLATYISGRCIFRFCPSHTRPNASLPEPFPV